MTRTPRRLVDQQTNLIRQLSGLIDVQVVQTGNGGIDLATSNGTLLVTGIQSFALTTDDAGRRQHRHFRRNGQDITSRSRAGAWRGRFRFVTRKFRASSASSTSWRRASRTPSTPPMRQGFDLNGNPGRQHLQPTAGGYNRRGGRR